jgi:glycine betaine/choline ABC-type transport system substrate-binding protein
VLKVKPIIDPKVAFVTINKEYNRLYGATWLSPFGFNN